MKQILILLLITAFISCKKNDDDNGTPANSAGNISPITYQITVTSNFKYPTAMLTDSSVLASVNYPGKNTLQGYTFSHTVTRHGTYSIRAEAYKYVADSTLHMLDNNPIWVRLKVLKNNTLYIDTTCTLNRFNPSGAVANHIFTL